MRCYRVENLVPVGSVLDGYTFTAPGNALMLRWQKLPVPITQEWNNRAVIGACQDLQQQPDGTVTGIVNVPAVAAEERFGLTLVMARMTEDWTDANGTIFHAGERVIHQIETLRLTTSPDPCGDVEQITECMP